MISISLTNLIFSLVINSWFMVILCYPGHFLCFCCIIGRWRFVILNKISQSILWPAITVGLERDLFFDMLYVSEKAE